MRRVGFPISRDLSLFLRRHFLDRIAIIAIRLRLHFDKYYRAGVVGDDIDLAEPGSVSPFNDGVSEPFEFRTREALAVLSDLLTPISHARTDARRIPGSRFQVPG